MKKSPFFRWPGKIQFSKFFNQILYIIWRHPQLPKYKFSWKNLENWIFPGQKTSPPPSMALTVYIYIYIYILFFLLGDCSSKQFAAIGFEIGEKLSDWRNFKKKFRPHPYLLKIFANSVGTDVLEKKTFSIFLRFQWGWQEIVRKSNPLIEKYPKKWYPPH